MTKINVFDTHQEAVPTIVQYEERAKAVIQQVKELARKEYYASGDKDPEKKSLTLDEFSQIRKDYRKIRTNVGGDLEFPCLISLGASNDTYNFSYAGYNIGDSYFTQIYQEYSTIEKLVEGIHQYLDKENNHNGAKAIPSFYTVLKESEEEMDFNQIKSEMPEDCEDIPPELKDAIDSMSIMPTIQITSRGLNLEERTEFEILYE